MKKNDGFTILETMIAIATLLVVSVFILQIFLSSSSLNNRTKNTDIAVANAVTAIENIKMHESLSDYLVANDHASASEGTVTVTAYYDKDWISIADTDAIPPPNADFLVRIAITADKAAPAQIEPTDIGVLYDVTVEIEALENNKILVSLQTKKYFPVSAGDRRPL